MKYLVGYDGGPASKRALDLAREQAQKIDDAIVFVVTSMEGGRKEAPKDIAVVDQDLKWAEDHLLKAQVQCETHQLARGLSPGEDLVKFAEDNSVDRIYLGIEKKSRTRKILLGSTAQFIILKGPCPVVTTK
jgi:nucleotide-binding universal stress UspA family protein